ncbi:hypothetical protein N7G274_009829 [Stereocaulon virgatum]|uniref:Carboxymuconolactone decarboxylase-like domain-containing protein n=1 Tax=Stereocaulon virgatum TaxID=373712 RepID=A0ABR3ZVZ4_9LECA
MPPPGIVTPALISAIRGQAHLPRGCWYFVAGVALNALNLSAEIPTVFRHAIENGAGSPDTKVGLEEKLEIARKMRESLVKAAAICGLPKSINSLTELKRITPQDLLDEPLHYSPTSRPCELYDIPSSTILHRGQRYFDMIYGKVSKRVMSQMDRSGTEDLGITARLMYGYLLSNTSVLSPSETSYVLLAGLIPQDVNPQLKGHIRGALATGSTVEEVKAVRDIIIRICEASGMKRLDETAQSGWGWKAPIANL